VYFSYHYPHIGRKSQIFFRTPPVFNATVVTESAVGWRRYSARENSRDGIEGDYESLMMCSVLSTQTDLRTDERADEIAVAQSFFCMRTN